ncbi:FkbM family methyltransferase [Salegentibacter sp. BDJ18]|uniref:FkbM family methyltransferase n=1 Tax=Salegentibacter sp. BDJ18 TaxID=2816376 RepID=UPI001AAF09E6|nr:FkbM family methyltransferase [Salegentibacter sp. BDJ18]MBO2544281.1 FkbM family methyltransferase [Salegentibacter sp. BDJ18]
MIVKTLHGFNLFINPIFDRGIERRIYNFGTYETGTLWCFDFFIQPGDIIIDAGANIGLTSIYVSKLTGSKGTVYAFEPLNSTFEILCKNIRINRIRNIVPLQNALSDYNGKGYIYPNIHINRGAASLNSNKVKQRPIEIEVKTVNSWIKEKNIFKIDFIKIDVEGSEFNLLKGASELFQHSLKPTICLEFSEEVSRDNNIIDLFYFLRNELGYKLFKSKLGKEEISKLIEIKTKEHLPKHDNIYCIDPKKLKSLSNILFESTK